MSKKPYPGVPPSYLVYDEIGGYKRSCLVIEIRSLGELNETQIATIIENLEATLAKLRTRLSIIEQTEVVTADRFDTQLSQGLRLPRN